MEKKAYLIIKGWRGFHGTRHYQFDASETKIFTDIEKAKNYFDKMEFENRDSEYFYDIFEIQQEE